MTWRERYRQLTGVPGAAMSFHGRDAGGAAVVVHNLGPAGHGRSQAVLHELMALPAASFAHVREIGEESGSVYVIVDDHFGAAELGEWLRRARAGEERYSQAGSWPRAEEETQEVPPPRVASAVVAPDEGAEEPGDFTRIFGTPLAPEPAKARPSFDVVAPVTAAPNPAGAEPGDFTKVFGSPLAPEPVKPPTASGGGEITVLFRRPPAAPATPATILPPPVPTPAPPENPGAEPGDFTRLLRTPAVDPAPVAAPDAPPPRPIETKASACGAGIGEYTRVIAARPPRAATAGPPEPTKAAPTLDTRPIAVFATLAALAVLMVLFFALRR